MLSSTVAQSIVDEVMCRLGHNINIMDRAGIIIGSGDPARLNTVHQGALRVLTSGQTERLGAAQARRWPGTRPGVNAPIRHGDQVVGVVGITGPPRTVAVLAGAVVLLAELLLDQHASHRSEVRREHLRQQLVQDLVQGEWVAAQVPDTWQSGALRLSPGWGGPVMALALDVPALSWSVPPALEAALQSAGALFGQVDTWWWCVLSPADAEVLAAVRTLRQPAQGLLDLGVVASVGALQGQIRLGLAAARMAPGRVIDLASEQHLALLADIDPASQRAYAAVLRALTPRLRATLECWLASDLNVGALAGRLGLHRNTLVYRLERIRSLTGADPYTAQGLVRLQLACWFGLSAQLPIRQNS
jgi:carbohydrate diacid regulator